MSPPVLDKASRRAVYGFAALFAVTVSVFVISRSFQRRGGGHPPPAWETEQHSGGLNAAEPTAEPIAVAAPAAPSRSLDLIDDMANGDNTLNGPQVMGYWYSYSDGTGTVRPPPRAPEFPPTIHEGRTARELSGGGFTGWGAGFGFDLTRRSAAGVGTGRITSPFDASAYSGIRFDGLSGKGSQTVSVQFSDSDTNVLGGVCDPRSTTETQCNGDYGTSVVLTGGWVTYTVRFSSLGLPEWARSAEALKNGFLKRGLYSIRFQPQKTGSDFDVYVANIYFIR